ncbi:MAG: flagellin [Oscillibacter sp.]|nr:flagellin [Oscillibacter sp.]
MRIQHNIAAMSSYRNYTNNVAAVNKNLEKLSSGYKINRAGDDAAGLAISEKMRAQISGLEAAQKNAKDGVSLVKTAEGALQEVHDMLNRMVTLATQSANGTYDNETDRYQLQKEVDQLKTEIDRIADSANFNGINLLDGSMATKSAITGVKDLTAADGFEVMADGQLAGKEAQPGVFTVDLSNAKIVNSDTENDLTASFTIAQSTVSITVAKGQTLQGQDLAKAIAAACNETDGGFQDGDGEVYNVTAENGILTFTQKNIPAKGLDTMGKFEFKLDGSDLNAHPTGDDKIQFSNNGGELHVTVQTEPVSEANQRIYGKAQLELTDDIVYDGGAIKIGDTTYVFAVGPDSQYKNYANAVDLTDWTGEADADELMRLAAGRLTTAAADNKSFIVGTDIKNQHITFTEKEGAVDYAKNNLAGEDGVSKGNEKQNDATPADWAGLIQIGRVNTDKSTNGLVLQIGDTADSYNQLRVSIEDCHTAAMGLSGVNIGTQEGAAAAIDKIKSAINYVSDVRGTLGATQNRLEHTQNNLSVMRENIQDAESTIRDTDIAEEMMAYTKNNILVQSAQAMLAQANQIPQGVLQLLG